MKPVSRRKFLNNTVRTAGLGAAIGCSPAGVIAAQGSRPQTLRVFSAPQAETYAAWCDHLAIGAAEAGVAFFVDKYLAENHTESLLLIRYLLNPPFADFYLGGIAGIEQESRARFSKPFPELPRRARDAVVHAAVTSSTVAWTEPNPNFFYFVSRSDAVDVVYGTMRGFRDLDIPYLQHIRPDRPW